MAETSRFWNTSNTGDGPSAGYDRSAISAFFAAVFARKTLTSGILRGVLNELAVTGTASPLTLATGAALVDGLYYENDSNASIAVTTPGVGTTGGRIVLRADWSAQTVRCVSKLNTNGNSAPPALTQTSGTTYELGLYTFTITTGGVIGSLTRDPALPTGYAKFSSSFKDEMLALAGMGVAGNPGASAAAGQLVAPSGDGVLRRTGSTFGFGQVIEAMIAAGGVDLQAVGAGAVDDSKVSNRVPLLHRRQGGDASSWGTTGSTNYTPGAVRVIGGVKFFLYPENANFTITMPSGIFSAIPWVLLSADPTWVDRYLIKGAAISTTQISGTLIRSGGGDTGFSVSWLAIGPA